MSYTYSNNPVFIVRTDDGWYKVDGGDGRKFATLKDAKLAAGAYRWPKIRTLIGGYMMFARPVTA